VAAYLRRELALEVELTHGKYGEFKVVVDGKVVIDPGAKAIVGILPTRRQVLAAVRERLV